VENDLISRSGLKSFLCKCCNVLHSDEPCEPRDCNVMGWVDELPAVDAVEVVRCEYCKYHDPENHHCDHATGTMIYFPRKPDDFCSYGERRNDV
jgi:hypothetical protein